MKLYVEHTYLPACPMQSCSFPQENLHSTSFTRPNANFPTEELVLTERIKSSYASSFNSLNFMIFYQGSNYPPQHSHTHPEQESNPCLTWTHYLPVVSHSPSAFYRKGIFGPTFPVDFLAQKFSNMNTFFTFSQISSLTFTITLPVVYLTKCL